MTKYIYKTLNHDEKTSQELLMDLDRIIDGYVIHHIVAISAGRLLLVLSEEEELPEPFDDLNFVASMESEKLDEH